MKAPDTPRDETDRRRRTRTLAAVCIVVAALLLPATAVAAHATEDFTEFTESDPSGEITIDGPDSVTASGLAEDSVADVYNEMDLAGESQVWLNYSFNPTSQNDGEDVFTGGLTTQTFDENDSLGTGPFMWTVWDNGASDWVFRLEGVGGGGTMAAEVAQQPAPYYVSMDLNKSTSTAALYVYNDSDRTELVDEGDAGPLTGGYSGDPTFDRIHAIMGSDDRGMGADNTFSGSVSNMNVSSKQIASLELTIQSRFHRNESASYTVEEILQDGSRIDVTDDATELSNRTSVLTVDDAGTAEAQDTSGWVRVNASYEGETANETTVVFNQTLEDYRFNSDGVKPILIFIDAGWLWLFMSTVLSAAICRSFDEEIGMLAFPGWLAAGWLVGFVSVWVPVAGIVVYLVVAFR